ncbi:MAG: ParB N-terminal domain-containing protein [Candidatus Bathyarchaeia archaeon]
MFVRSLPKLASKKSGGNNIPIKFRICLVDISSLKPHERTDNIRLKNLSNEIKLDGVLKKPIVADEKTNVIIDGHHRVEALKALGCTRIPVCYVDYMCDKIGLKTTAKGMEITKYGVVEAALNNSPFGPKSTWHYIKNSESIRHISRIQSRIDIPLEILK